MLEVIFVSDLFFVLFVFYKFSTIAISLLNFFERFMCLDQNCRRQPPPTGMRVKARQVNSTKVAYSAVSVSLNLPVIDTEISVMNL